MRVRSGEKERPWARVRRMIRINSNWYFVTREQTQEGPFSTIKEAEHELSLYIEAMKRRSFESLVAPPENCQQAPRLSASG